MAKKKNQDKGRHERVAVGSSSSSKSAAATATVRLAPWYRNSKQLAVVIAILAITFICFSPTLSSKKLFINWDDPVYITKQDLITKLDAPHLKKIFSDHDASLNYHPLTVLSLAENYQFSKLQPFGYFFTNLLLHLFNTFLVFIFLYRLALSSNNFKLQTSNSKPFWTAAIASVLFGIHPMHVESVAWAAERKDVLYCFFFLCSCIAYLSYIKTNHIKFLVACFILFLFSCLSKAMAVPLPLVLMLIDYYYFNLRITNETELRNTNVSSIRNSEKFVIRRLIEKIPFLIVSLILGYAAVKIQSKGAISDFHQYTLAQKFMFAAYGFMMYWVKLFAPINLSAFYPYPTLNNGDVSFIYKISPLVALLIVTVPLFISYKKSKSAFRILLFGFGFFFLMVALVLQFLSVGAAIMADRYSYLPYIGAVFIIGAFISEYIENTKTRTLAIAVMTVITAFLAVGCYNRVKVWNDDEKLWTDVIDKYPYVTENEGGTVKVTQVGVDIAYENRANFYRDHNEPDMAMADYELMTRLHSKSDGAYNNMGNFYGMKAQDAAAKGNRELANQMFSKALEMYSEAIRLKPGNIESISNRGITYSSMGDHRKAIDDFTAALSINPAATNLLTNIAFEKLQLGLYSESIGDCNNALATNPTDANVLFYRGTDYINLAQYSEAISDLSNAVKINPANSNAWYNLSVAYNKTGNRQQALEAALKARSNGYPISDDYLKQLKASEK